MNDIYFDYYCAAVLGLKPLTPNNVEALAVGAARRVERTQETERTKRTKSAGTHRVHWLNATL